MRISCVPSPFWEICRIHFKMNSASFFLKSCTETAKIYRSAVLTTIRVYFFCTPSQENQTFGRHSKHMRCPPGHRNIGGCLQHTRVCHTVCMLTFDNVSDIHCSTWEQVDRLGIPALLSLLRYPLSRITWALFLVLPTLCQPSRSNCVQTFGWFLDFTM